MKTIKKRQVGQTKVQVTELGFGGAPLGDLFERVPEQQAQDTLQAAWDAGIRYFDTSPFYGHGKSELRYGHYFRQKPFHEFVISTKVGRVFTAARDPDRFTSDLWAGALPFDFYFDYSYDGIMRSYEDSLKRFGLPAVDLLLIHDLDTFFHSESMIQAYLGQLITGGWRALEELKSAGCIKGAGAGLNMLGMIPRFLDLMPVDFFILAMPYTLLDQDALDVEFPLCQQHGVSIVIGSVFASGILVTGPTENALYGYKTATPEIKEKTRRIQEVCSRHGMPLPAAAMQFPLGSPVVSAIIPGALKPEFIHANIKNFHHPIPADLWAELKAEGLLRPDAPTPV